MKFVLKKDQYQICCLCGNKFLGYGHNAAPVKDGICCDECNYKIVIPQRLKLQGF